MDLASLMALAKKKQFEKDQEAIQTLGLERHVQELQDLGYTVLPPEVTGITPVQCDQMVGLLLARAEAMVGCAFDVTTGPAEELDYGGFKDPLTLMGDGLKGPKPSQIQLMQVAQMDKVFRDLATNRAAVLLIRQIVGLDATRLSSTNCFVKWRGDGYGKRLGMHCDQMGVPLPWSSTQALNANVNWCLTDYSKEGGALAIVPRSHLRLSHPVFPDAVKQAVGIEAPRGSAVVFHGATWHGAFPKRTDGLRVTIANYYRHQSIQPQEDIYNCFPHDLLEDCSDPKALKQLVGSSPYQKHVYPLPKPKTKNKKSDAAVSRL